MTQTAVIPQKSVHVIPAQVNIQDEIKSAYRQLRVAAYCRVSTKEEEQLNSYEVQTKYYIEKINSEPKWSLVEIFADKGISGTSLKKRDEFKRMIKMCKRGKIDMIITKSISRFARNTVDCLESTRLLKELGVDVFFEEQGIHSTDPGAEFYITIYGSIAQSESENISANVKWGKAQSAKEGNVPFQYKRFLGYRKGADGKPEIDPEQAENQIKEVEATLMELRAQRQQAEAELKLARVTYSRQQRLAQTQAVSQQDLDNAATEMAVKQAQIGTIDAQIKRNQASLDTAKTNLDYTRIVAPMAGEVTQITTLQGQTVIAAQQAPNILTLADMSTMLVKAQVSEADVIHLKPGQKAWFTVLGDPLTRYEGQIKDVLPTPEKINDAIFYYARFEVPNPNGLLRLDMTAQVHIQLTDVKNVLTIPLSALGDPVGDNRYKVKLLRNGETREREVTIGARNDTDVEIVKGLEAGDEVVIGEAKPGAAQ